MRVGDASLICSWAGTWVKLFAIFICFCALLEKPLLLTQHVDDQVNLLPDRVPPVKPVLIVAKVAQRRDLVHVAFELNHRRWRAILDDELNCGEGFQDAAPLWALSFKLGVKELSNTVNVLPIFVSMLLASNFPYMCSTYVLYVASDICMSLEFEMFQFSFAVASTSTFSRSSFAM